MKKLTIKEYAVSHKLSIYNVVKMTKNGTLQTEIKKVDGKDEVFIIENKEAIVQTATLESRNEEKIGEYEKAYFKLKVQYEQLKTKYENLQKKMDNLS